MKCDKCSKSYQKVEFAISVGETNICQTCVNKAASDCENVAINEVLAFVDNYRHGSNKRRMREACSGYYTEEEIYNAKLILHSKNPGLFGECVKRQDSHNGGRSKGEANVEDIYDWFRKLDDNDITLNIYAKNLKRIPKFNPEEIESTSVLERLIKLEETMKVEKETHLALVGRTSKLEERVFNGSESLENKLSQVNENLSKTETQIVKMSNEVVNMDKEIKTQKNSFSEALKTSLGRVNINNNNDNNRNNECSQCDKACTQKNDLTRHNETH